MSLFSVAQPNDLTIRAQNIYGEHFFTKDPGSGAWIPLEAGGSEVTIPYYLKPNEIDMDTSTDGVLIQPTGITLGDTIGNEIVTPAFVRRVPLLESRVTSVEGVNTTQGTAITAIQAKTDTITNTSSYVNTSFASTVSYKTHLNNIGLSIYSGVSKTTPTYPRIRIDGTSINMEQSAANVVFLDAARVDNIAKLASVSSIDFNDGITFNKKVNMTGIISTTDAANKMLVIHPTTKALAYKDIPNSSNVTDPIVFTSGSNTSTFGSSYISNQRVGDETRTISMSGGNLEFFKTTYTPQEVNSLAIIDHEIAEKIIGFDFNIATPPRETKWNCPNAVHMGVKTQTDVVNGEITNFSYPLYFFDEISRVGDVLWINMADWNTSVGTDPATTRGILFSCKAFENSINPQWKITYQDNTNVAVGGASVWVKNTTTDARHACFLLFAAKSGTAIIDKWVRIELIGAGEQAPVFTNVKTAYPTAYHQP